MFLGLLMFYVIETPLFLIYQHSPSIAGVGGWGGFNYNQICSRITSQTEKYWEVNDHHCKLMINERFQSFFITTKVTVYFLLLFHILRFICIFLSYQIHEYITRARNNEHIREQRFILIR